MNTLLISFPEYLQVSHTHGGGVEAWVQRQWSIVGTGPQPRIPPVWHDRGEQEAVRVLHTLGLYNFNTLVMGTAPASSECHERIRIILEGLEGVTQIKDDLVVHGKGQVHNDLQLVCSYM